MRYKDFFLLESWKDYAVSTSPKNLLYDFYVLSYLTTLPISPEQKGFAGSLIGRDPSEIKLDIQEAERVLLPALRDKLKEALFVAICAEIRHVFHYDQDWGDFKSSKLFKSYTNNYTIFNRGHDAFEPTRGFDTPKMTPKEKSYNDSFKAATKAINSTGSSRTTFAQLCSQMFRQLKWNPSYGGPKWAEIAEAYLLLSKHPQTNQQLQVAIDHAYDLQHNSGTVLNKVKEYYVNDDISWLKTALDDKADLKNVYELLPKASSDMRKLALEAFKAAGIKRQNLQQEVPGNDIKQKHTLGVLGVNKLKKPTGIDPKPSDVGKYIRYTSKPLNVDFIGKITSVPGNVHVEIVKIMPNSPPPFGMTIGQTAKLSDFSKMSFVDESEIEKLASKDQASFKDVNTELFQYDFMSNIGKSILFKSSSFSFEGTITNYNPNQGDYRVKITKIIKGPQQLPYNVDDVISVDVYNPHIEMKEDLVGKKVVWNSPTSHIEATIVNKVDNMYKMEVTKIIKDKFNSYKIGEIVDVHKNNINCEYFSFADKSKPQTTSSDVSSANLKSDYANKLSEIPSVGDIDEYFYRKLKSNTEFTNSIKTLSESERHELISELVRPITNAVVMSIGKSYFDKNHIHSENQSPRIRRIVSKLKSMYLYVNLVTTRSIKMLRNLLIKDEDSHKYNSFKENMIDSDKMNILAEKLRIEFFEEYADAIHKLFSMVKPSVPESPLNPYKHMIDYKDINEDD